MHASGSIRRSPGGAGGRAGYGGHGRAKDKEPEPTETPVSDPGCHHPLNHRDEQHGSQDNGRRAVYFVSGVHVAGGVKSGWCAGLRLMELFPFDTSMYV